MIRRTIPVPAGLHPPTILRMLGSHALPGAEVHDAAAGSHRRLLMLGHGPVDVTIWPKQDRVEVASTAPEAAWPELEARIRFWLDLDCDLAVIDEHLARDPLLAPLIEARPGLRMIRKPESFEGAVMTILGQQVSLARGSALGGMLLAAYGIHGPGGLLRFPTAAELADVPTEELRATLRLTTVRGTAVASLAGAVSRGLQLGPGHDPIAAREELLRLPGIGPWSADYMLVRIFGEQDAFTPTDLVLRRALGNPTPAQALASAEKWRPWRAYALAHLWAEAGYK